LLLSKKSLLDPTCQILGEQKKDGYYFLLIFLKRRLGIQIYFVNILLPIRQTSFQLMFYHQTAPDQNCVENLIDLKDNVALPQQHTNLMYVVHNRTEK